MFRRSRRLAQAVEYISRHEFLDALAEVCPAAVTSKHNGGLPLGKNPIMIHLHPIFVKELTTGYNSPRCERWCRLHGPRPHVQRIHA